MNIIKDWFIPKTNNKSYSELSDTFKLKENMSDDDLVYMSHKRSYDDTYPIMVNQVVEGDFKCSRCKKPSHAGVWGKNYPQPCFWCKGEYVYPGSKTANDCNDFELMDDSWYGDTRPVLC